MCGLSLGAIELTLRPVNKRRRRLGKKQRIETKDGLWSLRGDFFASGGVYLISRFIRLRKANIKTVWLVYSHRILSVIFYRLEIINAHRCLIHYSLGRSG